MVGHEFIQNTVLFAEHTEQAGVGLHFTPAIREHQVVAAPQGFVEVARDGLHDQRLGRVGAIPFDRHIATDLHLELLGFSPRHNDFHVCRVGRA